jgi:hypothetical protein
MVKKFQLLLLDANIVIELFRLGIWDKFLEHCDVHLSRTIAEIEVCFFVDEYGDQQPIDLSSYIQDDRITIFDASIAQLQALEVPFKCKPMYIERFDPGEAEALAFMVDSTAEYMLCSADSIVFKSLGFLGREDQALSLERILAQIGLSRTLTWQFRDDAREKWLREGFMDSL